MISRPNQGGVGPELTGSTGFSREPLLRADPTVIQCAVNPGTNTQLNERLTTMAKKKGAGESISGYFRQLFRNEPELLDHGKNDVILARWQADHPGEPVTESVKNNMSNVKSNVRKEFGKVKRRRK